MPKKKRLNYLQRQVKGRIEDRMATAIGGRLTLADLERWPDQFPPKTVRALVNRGHLFEINGRLAVERPQPEFTGEVKI